MAMLMTACSDVVKYDEDVVDIFAADGAPEIVAIYDVQDTGKKQALEAGTLNQMIRIEGKNLSHVTSVTFNGIPVKVSEIYATSAASYLKIPRVIPQKVNNQLVYTTELGTITRTFKVDVPSLKLNGLSNEFCEAGETVAVSGEFFDLYDFGKAGSGSTITLNGQEVKVASINESGMSIVIPEGTPDRSLLEFKWTEMGGVKKEKKIPFRNNIGMLLPADLTTVGWWDKNVLNYITNGTHPGDPKKIATTFFRITGHFDQWSWNQFGGGGNWPEAFDCRQNPEDYVFKFEVCSNGDYPFPDSEGFGYHFALADNPNWSWNPSQGVSFNTYGKWQTISIPLTNVAGVKPENPIPAPGTWGNFCMVMQPNSDGGWTVDHSFANFRIEPANY